MRYRIVKPSDIKQIVTLHYDIRSQYDAGFFAKMSKGFLKEYYRVVLNDPNYIAICAVNDNNVIDGFISASLNAEEQLHSIKKRWYKFIFPTIISIIKSPKIIKEIKIRFDIAINNKPNIFYSTDGVRGEYWVWSTTRPNSAASVQMQNNLMNLLGSLGYEKLYSEVDEDNKKVVKFHKINGSKEIERITLPDGRVRIMLVQNLIK